MRLIAALILAACPAFPQFKSTVPLVVAPTTVTDRQGHLVDGLTENDLAFFDNSVPQAIQVHESFDPISLVVLIEANSSSEAILDKLGRSGILFADLLSAEQGETALVSFADSVKVIEPFTSDSGRLSRTLKGLRPQGDGCALLDGIHETLQLLAGRDPGRRSILLVIAERRDRSSRIKLETLAGDRQVQNTTIYWLTYSTFLAPFTNKPKTVWDRMSDEEKARTHTMQGEHKYAYPEEEVWAPPETGSGNLLNIFTELAHKTTVDAASLFSHTTGGRTFSFLKQSGLEEAIQAVGEEVHRQYIVSFQPKPDAAGLYHSIRAEVKGRPDLVVRTRAGYWSVP
ncbi:MAG TPA: VWA domain-containing protein [Bryobacteraceae bacterium]|nr:VWA domain-containing protein [Bryobacteraceae bacterium]